MQNRLEAAKDSLRYGRRPREIGTLHHDFLNPEIYDPIKSAKAHMRNMTTDEWKQVAHDIRRGKVLRLCNDEVIHALLRLWVES